MPTMPPFHSIKPSAGNVYHNNIKCTEGSHIESRYWRTGMGGRPLCDHCERLQKLGS